MGKGDSLRPAQVPAPKVKERWEQTFGVPVARPCPGCGSKAIRMVYTASEHRCECSRCRMVISRWSRG